MAAKYTSETEPLPVYACDLKINSKPRSKGNGRNKGYGTTQEPMAEFGETGDEGDGEASNRMYTDSNRSTLAKKRNAETKGYRNSINGSMETETLLASKGEQGSPPSTVWAAIRTVRTASFFTAVVLSGMGAGVIDTFLFMRYVCIVLTYGGTQNCFYTGVSEAGANSSLSGFAVLPPHLVMRA